MPLFRWIEPFALPALLLSSGACAQTPPAPSMRAALDRGVAAATAQGPAVQCTREPEKLSFSCVEQIDPDHFTAVEVVAQPIVPGTPPPRAASDPVIGPGGGGGRYSVTTAGGTFAIHATEFQRLTRGAHVTLPAGTRLLAVIKATYDGTPAPR